MDLTFRNGTTRVLYLGAHGGEGVRVTIEAEIDGVWNPIAATLEELCVPACGSSVEPDCAPPPEPDVVYALWPAEGVTRHLEGEWWRLAPGGDCAREAPIRADLRATVCWDDRAVETSTGQTLEEPASSGIVGEETGASLALPQCDSFPFDNRQAFASGFLVGR